MDETEVIDGVYDATQTDERRFRDDPNDKTPGEMVTDTLGGPLLSKLLKAVSQFFRVRTVAADSWHTLRVVIGQDTATGNGIQRPQEILGRDSFRLSVTIVNAGPNAVEITHLQQGSPGQGFPLASGQSIDLDTRAPIYGILPSGGATTTVAYAVTREDG